MTTRKVFLNPNFEQSFGDSVKIVPNELQILTQVKNDIYNGINVKGCIIIYFINNQTKTWV